MSSPADTLQLDPTSIREWLLSQPGGHVGLDTGLGDDVMANVSMALEDLAERLVTELVSDPAAFSERLRSEAGLSAFRQLAQHLSTGRRLKLLAWFAQCGMPEAPSFFRALFHSASPPIGSGADLLVDLRRLHQAACLEDIFSPERLVRVEAACRRGEA